MLSSVVTQVRDLLPKRLQVPAKYWFRWLRRGLEKEMVLLDAIIRKNDRVLDVGGNRGVYAYRFWRLGAAVEVFEPNSDCHEILAEWAEGKPRVNLHAVALSNREGAAILHIPVDKAGVKHDASASIETMDCTQTHDQSVVLRTLDSYKFKGVSLIKIDVEGHEYGVIEGAEEALSLSMPALLVEVEERHNSRPIGVVFEKIIGLGYAGFFLEDGGLTAISHFDVTRHQSMNSLGKSNGLYINNFLFLHKNKLANGEYKSLVKWGLR
ncbi:MAG: FkbM family methyltransferase [Halioglobus sp.]